MKRIIGQIAVAALMAGGLGLFTASPSSAVVRNGCLDEQHWIQAATPLWNTWDAGRGVAQAYDEATSTIGEYGTPVYDVTLPSGITIEYTTYTDYKNARSRADGAADAARTRLVNFVDNVPVCSL